MDNSAEGFRYISAWIWLSLQPLPCCSQMYCQTRLFHRVSCLQITLYSHHLNGFSLLTKTHSLSLTGSPWQGWSSELNLANGGANSKQLDSESQGWRGKCSALEYLCWVCDNEWLQQLWLIPSNVTRIHSSGCSLSWSEAMAENKLSRLMWV